MGAALLGSLLLFGFVKRMSTTYLVSTQRLYIRRGVLSKRIQQTRIDRVQNVNTDQSLRDRLLRVGTVDFDTAGTDDSEFKFVGIASPASVVAAVDRAQREAAVAPEPGAQATPASISCFQTSAWSTTSTPSFSAFAVLLAPTFSPVMSRSVLAETEDAVVAPARSHRRWNAGRGTFSPLRGSAIVPVTTTVLPASGASAATCGGRSSSSTSRFTPSSRRRTSSARVVSRLRWACRLAATFGPTSSTCWSASSPASATSSSVA